MGAPVTIYRSTAASSMAFDMKHRSFYHDVKLTIHIGLRLVNAFALQTSYSVAYHPAHKHRPATIISRSRPPVARFTTCPVKYVFVVPFHAFQSRSLVLALQYNPSKTCSPPCSTIQVLKLLTASSSVIVPFPLNPVPMGSKQY